MMAAQQHEGSGMTEAEWYAQEAEWRLHRQSIQRERLVGEAQVFATLAVFHELKELRRSLESTSSDGSMPVEPSHPGGSSAT